MYRVVKAIYQDGVLKPAEALPLEDRQQVVITILPLGSATPPAQPNPEWVAVLMEQAAAWLKQQPAETLHPPRSPESAGEEPLDVEIEHILAAIRARGSQLTPEEIAADASQALVESRMIPGDERAGLEAELDAPEPPAHT